MPLYPKLEYQRYKRYFVDLRALYKRKEVVVYTGLTLSLFAIAFFGLFALRPTFLTIAALLQELKNRQEIESRLQTKINSLAKAQTNYSLIGDKLFLVEETLPQNANLTQVVYQLEGLSQSHGLTLRSLSFDEVDLVGEGKTTKISPKKSLGPKEIIFSLGVRGNYEDLENFLSDLENLRRVIVVDSFSFSRVKSETEETTIINLNLEGRAFYNPKTE